MFVLVNICGFAVKGFSDFDLYLFAFSEPRQPSVNTLNGRIVCVSQTSVRVKQPLLSITSFNCLGSNFNHKSNKFGNKIRCQNIKMPVAVLIPYL